MGNATMTDKTPHPVSINLHSKSRLLLIEFDDGSNFELSCEFLRVYSPSAEVKGHGPGQQVLQIGKEDGCSFKLFQTLSPHKIIGLNKCRQY